MQHTSKARRWLGTATAVGLSVGLFGGLLVGVAHADYQPSPTDVVGIGGETPQYNVDFVANGDIGGDPGYNSTNNVNKLVSVDATADSNGRAAYAQGSTQANQILLNPTVVLRAGAVPTLRVTSSGNAITAILADTGAVPEINFIRSSSLPSTAQQNQAGTQHWGFLHVVQLGIDPQVVVAATTTNAPPLSIAELLGIYTGAPPQYTKWNQLPGNSGGSSDTIVPLLPPSSSAITKTFVADLTKQNGGTAITLASNVVTVEQNDPTAITGPVGSPNPVAADSIVPFSQGRLNLWNGTVANGAGYFHNPATAYPGSPTPLNPGVKTLTGTAGDGASAYTDVNPLDVIFRQTDSTDAPWQPGGTLNWVQTLFSDPNGPPPYFATGAGQALVAAAGGIPGYNDIGLPAGT